MPPWHPQILADQLTLSQPRGADYAHQIILAPTDFKTFRRPWFDKVRFKVGLKRYIGYSRWEKLRYIQFSIAKVVKNYSRNLEPAWHISCCFFWYSVLMFFALGLLFLTILFFIPILRTRKLGFTHVQIFLIRNGKFVYLSPMINCMASAKISLCCLIFIAWKIKSWTRLSEDHYISKFIDTRNVKCYIQ